MHSDQKTQPRYRVRATKHNRDVGLLHATDRRIGRKKISSEVLLLRVLVRLCLLLLVVAALVLVVLVLLLGLLLLFGHLHLLEGRVGVDAELLRHEAVDAVDQCGGVGDLVAGLDECSLEEHLRRVHRSLVLLVGLDLGQEVRDHGVVGVHLQGLAARHHGELVLVLEGLGLHNLLLLCGVAELRRHDDHGRLGEPLGELDLLDLDASVLHGALLGEVRELLLPPVREGLVHVLQLGELLLLRVGLVQLHVGLLNGHKLLALVVGELLQAGLVEVV
mmetsp:Transcript_108296/g.338848  ORF Transcript_108296/g.338848 Transcript_108296/m.338848 type:complete len:276 (-) Transcript_108296:514-1341(-)